MLLSCNVVFFTSLLFFVCWRCSAASHGWLYVRNVCNTCTKIKTPVNQEPRVRTGVTRAGSAAQAFYDVHTQYLCCVCSVVLYTGAADASSSNFVLRLLYSVPVLIYVCCFFSCLCLYSLVCVWVGWFVGLLDCWSFEFSVEEVAVPVSIAPKDVRSSSTPAAAAPEDPAEHIYKVRRTHKIRKWANERDIT